MFAITLGVVGWCPHLRAAPAVAAAAGSASVAMPGPGAVAPDFTVRGPGGREISLHDFRGKVVAVDFWATWCGPCQSAMPNDERVYQKYKNDGFVLLGVCVDDTLKNYNGWVRLNAARYTFPTGWDPAGTDYRHSFVGTKYGVTGFPTTFVIGRDGKIVGTVIGGGPGIDHRLERVIAKAGVPVDLAGLPPPPKENPNIPKAIPMMGKTPAIPRARFGDIAAGKPAENFKVIEADGRAVQLSDFKGKTVVLHFWLANMGPRPDLEKVYRLYHKQGLVVLGICAASTRAEFEKWVAAHGKTVSYPVAWDPAGRAWADSVSNTDFGIGMYPATGVINADGNVVGGFIGYGRTSPARLRTLLAEAGIKLAADDVKPVRAIPALRIMPHPAGPAEAAVATLKPGAVAPDFTAYDLKNRPVKLSGYRGKIVVLDFWATWCGPCMASMPHTEKVAAETKHQGVAFLADCTSDTRANFDRWVKANQAKYPDLRFVDDPNGRDKPPAQFARRVSHALYGVVGIPTQFVIDRAGRITAVLVGYDRGDARLEASLARLGVKLDPATVAKGEKQLQAEAAAAAKKAGKAPMRQFDLDHFGKFKTGDVIPDFTAEGPDGKPVKLSDFRGKTVVLDFWATWCGPCQMAMPHYETLYKKYKDRGLVVLGICAYDTRQNYEQWLAKYRGKYTFPTAFDPAGKARTPKQFAATIGQKVFGTVFLLPTTGVINPQGVLVGGYAGFGEPNPSEGYPGSVDFLENLLVRAGFKLDPADRPKVIIPEVKASKTPAPAEPSVSLLKPGAIAPNFSSQNLAGQTVRLSDFKGKIVVLDFWATWCGPCMASMPHTEKVAAETKDQGVVFLTSCTADSRRNFSAWVPRHQTKYPDLTFTYDPAGRNPDRVSRVLYGVSGIPTQFVIGRDGRVKAVIVGYDGPRDSRLERALAAAGVKIDLSRLPPPPPSGPRKIVPALKLKPAAGA